MSLATTISPMTARSLLAEGGMTDLGRSLAESHAFDDAKGELSKAGDALLDGARAEVASMVGGFLGLDIATMIVAGWRKHRELLDAAVRTKGTEASEVVSLATRDLSLVQHPTIEVYLDKTMIKLVTFELRVTVSATGLAGVVRSGNLVGLTTGTCTITVSLAAASKTLATAKRVIDPHLVVHLGQGIPLLPAPSRIPVVEETVNRPH